MRLSSAALRAFQQNVMEYYDPTHIAAGEIAQELWKTMREVAPRLADTPPAEWTVALESVLLTRPPASGDAATTVTSVYMDDGLTAGWLVGRSSC